MARIGEGVPNDHLLVAGLELMRLSGKMLTRLPGYGRSMRYSMPNGETVRIRTCNDHILIVLADRHSGNAKLNIEGTDWLLIVMPEIPRTPGKVLAYLVPTREAAMAVRQTHQDWLDTDPNTKGNNTTWNIWFDPDGPVKANDFANKWHRYKLNGTVDSSIQSTIADAPAGTIKFEVEAARLRIAKAAGVPPASVTISIGL